METRTKLQKRVLNLMVMAGLCTLLGCGSSSSSPMTSSSTTTNAAPMVVTVSDAPLSNILSAQVMISAVSLSAGSSSSSVSLLTQPVTVELSGLGAVQEPIEITNLAFGTYNSATVAISAAQVTYINSAGHVTTVTATLGKPTVTVALMPALNISSKGEVQLQLAFNLAQSFSMSGSTVTFTPAINTMGAQVSTENSGDRQLEVSGQVISISSSSITVQSGDSGKQFAFTINSSTQFPNGAMASSIQTGSIVQVEGQTQADGSLLALMITPESNENSSGKQEDGAKGIIVSVTKNGSGAITAFTMVPRESFGSSSSSASLNVAVSSSTTYGIPEGAQQVGVASSAFTAVELFPGQSVVVTGTAGSSGTLNAQQVMLAAESIPGTLAATPQGSSPNFTFVLTLAASSYLTTYDSLTSLDISANQATEYGNSLSASSFAALAAGASVETHGYLLQDGSGHFAFYATEISQVETPETPEGGGD
ncbi:MAG TPA: DUF5666 domain-containing protein [Acidobacteriaceae bacterium]|nr:DUF5666 domain-containing protein [Acidobacteriaceae bacterium]